IHDKRFCPQWPDHRSLTNSSRWQRVARISRSAESLLLTRPSLPGSTLFPYTTLFRSYRVVRGRDRGGRRRGGARAARRSAASPRDRKSTSLNSSHDQISYAVFCLKKKRRGLREREILFLSNCCVLVLSLPGL